MVRFWGSLEFFIWLWYIYCHHKILGNQTEMQKEIKFTYGSISGSLEIGVQRGVWKVRRTKYLKNISKKYKTHVVSKTHLLWLYTCCIPCAFLLWLWVYRTLSVSDLQVWFLLELYSPVPFISCYQTKFKLCKYCLLHKVVTAVAVTQTLYHELYLYKKAARHGRFISEHDWVSGYIEPYMYCISILDQNHKWLQTSYLHSSC